MGKDRRIRIAVAVIGLLALFLAGAGDRAYAVSAVQTTTVTSGQVPTATQWNTYLNRAENWINSNLLNGGTTFTFAEGESLAVLGTLKVDSLRVTGFIDLAAHIIPRISRTYRIGNPTFLLSALHVDTARIVNGVIDSLSGAVVTTSTFSATPATNSTGRLGSNGKRYASVNVDTVRHTVAFDSNDVSKIAPGDVDTANTAWVWGYANVQVNSQDSTKIRDGSVSYADHAALSIDSLKVRASSISGSNLAPVLGGNHKWPGGSNLRAYDAIVDSAGFGDYTTVDGAIDAGAKSIFIRNGTYAGFTADVAGLTIVGQSQVGVLIDGGTGGAIVVSASNVLIQNLSATNTTGGDGDNTITGTAGSTYLTLRHIRVVNSDNIAIILNVSHALVDNCTVNTADGRGILVGPLASVVNSTVSACGADGIEVQSDYCNIQGNFVNDTILISTGSDSCVVTNNLSVGAITDNGAGNSVANNEIITSTGW